MEYEIREERRSYDQKAMVIQERTELHRDITSLIKLEDWRLKMPLNFIKGINL